MKESILGNETLLYLTLVDFSGEEPGNLYCDEIKLSRYNPPSEGTEILKYDTASEFASWSTLSAPGLLDPVESGVEDDSIWLESPEPMGETPVCFGGWSSPIDLDGPAFEPDALYCAVFTIRSDEAFDRDQLPMIRLRIGNCTFDWVSQRSVRTVSGREEHMPSTTGTEYAVWIDSPPRLDDPSSTESDAAIILNFDIVDGSDEQSGRIYLDAVKVMKYSAP